MDESGEATSIRSTALRDAIDFDYVTNVLRDASNRIQMALDVDTEQRLLRAFCSCEFYAPIHLHDKEQDESEGRTR